MKKNILITALVNLGDVVLITGAIALIKRALPDSSVAMLVKPEVAGAVMNHPLIDDVIIFRYTAKERSLTKMLSMVSLIRRKNFDLSISFDRKLRPAVLAFLAGIPVRVGADRIFENKTSRVTMLYTDTISMDRDVEHTLQRETYQEIVRKFFKIEGGAHPVMAKIEPSDNEKASSLLKSCGDAEKKIALCVKGTFPLKTWPKEYFAETVGALSKKYNADFFVVGAPGDKEYAAEVIESLPVRAENFCGKTTLPELAALLGRADLFLTVDTGSAHIAAAAGAKMVVVYGCTHPLRWSPDGDIVRTITADADCCPCKFSPEECPSWPKPECLWRVTPQKVLKSCKELLNNY